MVVSSHTPDSGKKTELGRRADRVTMPNVRRGRGGARQRESGALSTECVLALGMLAVAVIPLLFAFMQEAAYSRACYYRAAAMEIVDGEMEILAAGEWKAFAPGQHDYPVKASSATNLPPGRFKLSVEAHRLRLEWRPTGSRTNNTVARERELP